MHLAEKIGFSRNTIANAATGRQNVPREFWESVDTAVSVGGTLVAAHLPEPRQACVGLIGERMGCRATLQLGCDNLLTASDG